MFELTKKITLTELAAKLKLPDSRAAKKWLNVRSIPYIREGRDNFVSQWQVEFYECLEMAKDLKKKFPKRWFKVFEVLAENKKMVKAVFEVFPPTVQAAKVRVDNNTKRFF